MDNEDLRARMVLSYLAEPGDTTIGKFLGLVTPIELVNMIVRDDVAIPSDEWTKLMARVKPRWRDDLADEIEADCTARGIVPVNPYWIEGLHELGESAPVVLYVRGNLDVLVDPRPRLAIVGARAATSYGEHEAMEFASDLSRDHVIVSGAAYGIDGAAHRATMMAGGRTIAFLAGGVDRPYPAGHNDLIRRIGETGAIVSELPPGSAPTKWRFLQRNRLIAASSMASLVVEAGWRSGSLNEAGHALALNRKVGAIPGPLTSAASAGCHRLIREMGATLITTPNDVRELVGTAPKEQS
jgi:DNA processing protein